MKAEHSKTTTMIKAFIAAAESTPQNTAVAFKKDNVWCYQTYQELYESAAQVASCLIEKGIQPGEAVVLPAVRTGDLCAQLLGIAWVGAHYVFIDTRYPIERQQFICKEVKARIGLFSDGDDTLSALNLQWINPSQNTAQADPPPVHDNPETPIYVIFTSGSTGTPKGVVVPHRAVVRLVKDTDYINFSSEEVFLQLSSLSFDASTLELWGALLNGGTCVLHPEVTSITPKGIEEVICEQQVTTLWLTCSLYNAIITEHPDALKALKQLLIGGEALSVSHVKKGLALLPDTRIYNGYGPTENTTFTTVYPIPNPLPDHLKRIPIGFPINGTQCDIIDANLKPVTTTPKVGELVTFGEGLALGYLNRESLTQERFIYIQCRDGVTRRGYRTGDLVVQLDDGSYDYLQRNDKQIKIDGNRIEPGEIELCLNETANVKEARVVVKTGPHGQKRLAAYVVGIGDIDRHQIRQLLSDSLPAYMVPHFIIPMKALPKNQNGKLDEAKLPDPFEITSESQSGHQSVAACWAEILGRQVAEDENFIDAGGTSLEAVRLTEALEKRFNKKLPPTFVFEYPTIFSQTEYFDNKAKPQTEFKDEQSNKLHAFAVVGMACRLPGANNVTEFWQNLLAGKESVSFFSDSELSPEIPPEERNHKNYVPAKGIIDDCDKFDAAFFGISPAEADIMDPQHRIMLELAWHALEDSGFANKGSHYRTGVFAGANWPRYFQQYVLPNKTVIKRQGIFNASLGNESDFLSSRISYKLNLKGPSVNVFTACSTGLVAISQACAAIEQNQCEVAIAGGVSVSTPVNSGYLYQEGSMLSADGHCRPFDAKATGTTFNDGAGMVVIKRLDLAEKDGDQIYGIIKGHAINNDGEQKASFTAPSVSGQVSVYKSALENANIDPTSIGFIETHGTATPLGDPIEVEALRQSYTNANGNQKTCAIGSVKSNIGHTIHAAGVASFIKTILAVKHGKIPATLFYQSPNPKLELEKTPFFINNQTIDWHGNSPRRAAVSSLGVGGTNAHIIVEEYTAKEQTVNKDTHTNHRVYPVLLSAKSPDALERMRQQYIDFLSADSSNLNISDIAYTTLKGRVQFQHRLAVAGSTPQDLANRLNSKSKHIVANIHEKRTKKLGFLFTGQGSQRVQMGVWLYQHNDDFRNTIDTGSEIIKDSEGFDIRSIVFNDSDDQDIGLKLNQTKVAQPALFLLEYALANHLITQGCKPDFMIGHSIGEFAAACVSGVFTFEDCVKAVARRGALMQSMPTGSMLAVKITPQTVSDFITTELSIAAINGPEFTVVSGAQESIDELASKLSSAGITATKLHTSHGFHSAMMDPVVPEFEKVIRALPLNPPRIPIISTASGGSLSAEEATSPVYWATQLRKPVLFSQAITTAVQQHNNDHVGFCEVGPGNTLATLASSQLSANEATVTACLPSFGSTEKAPYDVLQCLGTLWSKGFPICWDNQLNESNRKIISLPGYPFTKDRHWLTPVKSEQNTIANVIPGLEQLQAHIENTHLAVNGSIQPMPQEVTMSSDQHIANTTQKLRSLLEDVTGYDLTDLELDTHFSEAGLDSLLLTQVATALAAEFDLDITFRHLVEEFTCLGDLASHIAENIPMETPTESQNAPQNITTTMANNISNPQAPGAAAPSNALQELINAQMQLMQLQLQALSGAAPTVQTLSAPAVSTPAEPTSQASEPKAEKTKTRHTPGTRIAREKTHIKLSNAQRKWLDSKLSAYQNKFAGSKNYTQKHRKYFADPRSVSGFNPQWKEIIFPIVTERSKGSKLWDIDGNELIDVSNGFGPILFGHSLDFVTHAVKEQLDKGIETGPQSPLAGEVAKLFCELTGNERCSFASTGSEAVMGAIRLARTVTGKSKVIMFEGSYHGIFDEVINRPGRDYQALPAAPGIPREMTQNMMVVPWAEQESLDIIRSMGKDIAAVLVEPVQSRKPEFHDQQFLQSLRDITQENNSALILDEVVTGFRVHPGGIRKLFNIDADIATYGKVVGGGYPIGIIGGKAKFLDALDGGYWQYGDESIPECGVTFFAGTFVRHPVALAAANAIMNKIKDEGTPLYDKLSQHTSEMAQSAKQFISEMNCHVSFENFASLFYISVPDTAQWGHMLFTLMTMEGIHIQQYRPNFLTTEHNESDRNKILNAFKKSLAELISHGFIEGDIVAANRYLKQVSTAIPDGARLGKNARGEPAYFIEDPNQKGKYIEIGKP